MIDELEALVGNVFVVGGRAVSAMPPGALVQLPPRKPPRGREQDTFFTLVTAAGANQGQAAFYEQLARLAADLYFHTGGGVTSGLREAITAVNNYLIEHNQMAGQRYEANMICMVLRGREAYVARTGSCVSLLRQGESFVTFPDDLRDEYALNSLPLGYSPVPDIKLAHYDVAPEHVMVLSDAGLAQADRESLNAALGAGNVQAVIEPLKTLGGSKAQATVIEFVSTDTPDPTVLTPQPGSKITRSSSAPAAAPVQSLSATGTVTAPVTPAAAPTEAPIEPLTPPMRRLTPAPETVAVPPPARAIVTEPGQTSRSVSRTGRRAAGGLASFLGGFARGLNAVLNRLLPEPEEGTPHIPAMLAAGLAILVPVVVVFVMVALRLSQVDLTQFEQAVREVEFVRDQAETIPLTDVDRAKTAWLGVLQRIDNVEATSGRTNDPTLMQIRARAQGILDNYAKVTRRSVTPLRSFGDSVKLVGPVVQGGIAYTLDGNQSAIYQDRLNQSGDGIATRGTQPIVQQGSAVGSRAVRQLVDITWMAEGGVQRANVLAALDTQGILVTYSPTFAPATSQPLAGVERWVTPVAMATWQKRMYVLDAGANQIWRYLPEGSTYPDAPQEYFDTDFRPNLKEAVDFGIDSAGNVYVLFANGALKKYNGGAEQPFNFNGLPEDRLKSGGALYLDNDSALPALYLTDPLDNSIYQVTLAGTFQHRFKSSDPNAFRALSGVFVDRDNVYVLSGSLLYYFSMGDATGTPRPVP